MSETTGGDPLSELLCEVILAVAPDLTRDDLRPTADFQLDLGLDSIDALNIAAGIAERIGLDIPELDRARLRNFAALLAYVAAHRPAPR